MMFPLLYRNVIPDPLFAIHVSSHCVWISDHGSRDFFNAHCSIGTFSASVMIRISAVSELYALTILVLLRDAPGNSDLYCRCPRESNAGRELTAGCAVSVGLRR
jgi:hypothetical protein